MAKKKSNVDILLEIFEYVPDAGTVELLIEPAHLLLILGQCGQSEDGIRAKLKEKTTPGELLLGLFHDGRTSEELVAMLPANARAALDSANDATKKKAPRKASTWGSSGSRKRSSSTVEEVLDDKMTFANKVGGELLIAVAIAPAILISGIFGGAPIGTQTMWLTVAGLGGALCGAVFAMGRTPAWVGVVSGSAAALGGLLVTQWWITERTTLMKIEVILAPAIGMLPGLLFYVWLARRPRYGE